MKIYKENCIITQCPHPFGVNLEIKLKISLMEMILT